MEGFLPQVAQPDVRLVRAPGGAHRSCAADSITDWPLIAIVSLGHGERIDLVELVLVQSWHEGSHKLFCQPCSQKIGSGLLLLSLTVM